jgi:hypothetical protein
MRRPARFLPYFLCAWFFLNIAFAQGPEAHRITQPSYFAPDEENRGFDASDPPSDTVLDALLKTPEAWAANPHFSQLAESCSAGLQTGCPEGLPALRNLARP